MSASAREELLRALDRGPGLWLPACAYQAKQVDDPRVDIAVLAFSLKELCEQQPTIHEVIAALSTLPPRVVVQFVSWASAQLDSSKDSRLPRTADLRILERLCPASQALKISASLTAFEHEHGLKARLFHPCQLQNLVKLRALGEPHSAHQAPDLSKLLYSALGLNGLIYSDLDGIDIAKDEGRKALEASLFASFDLNRAYPLLEEVARTYQMYCLADASWGKVDLDSRSRKVSGLPCNELMFTLWMLHVLLFSPDPRRQGENRISLDQREITRALKSSSAETSSWLANVAVSWKVFAERSRARYTKNDPRYSEILISEMNPLVSFESTSYCLSPALLRDLFGSGFKHRFLATDKFTKKETKQFLDARGTAFEVYALSILRRTFGPTRLVEEDEIKAVARKGEFVCDAAIAYGDAALLFECKARVASLRARSGSSSEFEKAVRETFVSSAGQIASAISIIERGGLVSKALGLPGSCYYPIIVTADFSLHPTQYEATLQAIDEALGARPNHTMPYQFLDIRDLEIMETAVQQGDSLRELLREKCRSLKTRSLSLREYCSVAGKSWYGMHNPHLSDVMNKFHTACSDWVRHRLA